MIWKRSRVLLAVLCVLCITALLSAQNITSSIVGQVNDAEGNGINDARIVITNADTGISVDGVSSGTGAYAVTNLQPGTYIVTIQAPGFSVFKGSNVVVEAAETVRINANLKVGAISQTIEVTDAAPLIQSDTPTLEGTLNAEQIRNLPSGVESIASLFAVVPGANFGGSTSNPQFAGSTHWGAVNYSVNGVSVNDPVNGGGIYSYSSGAFSSGINVVNLPAVDTLQEFRVVDVNENAEFRDMGSVIMVTKQGTNRLHGDVYEFLQNADLNANTYQLKASGKPRAQDNLNQFGGQIGGPIYRNKVFLFFSPVYMRRSLGNLASLKLPTAAEASGDFSALLTQSTQLYNPFTGEPFTNNQITSSLITSQAKTLLKYLPAPTVKTSLGLPYDTYNYYESVPTHNSMSNYTVRGDYAINQADSLSAVFMHNDDEPWNVFLGGPSQWGNASDYGDQGRSVSLGETHIFNSNTVNDFRASWFVHTTHRNGQNGDFDPTTLFSQLTPGENRGLPTMSGWGYSTLFSDAGYAAGQKTSGYTVEFNENFTKTVRNHTLKFGVDESGYKNFSHSRKGNLGSFTFTGYWTGNTGWYGQPSSQGNSFADFLLGTASSATRGTVAPDAQQTSRDWETFAQDSWQATSHLTLYYGLRYAYQTPWAVRNNARSFFDMANNKLALPEDSATATLPTLGNSAYFNAFSQYFETTQSIGMSTNYISTPKNNFGPRLGFAYRPFNNWVIRGGYGIYYNFIIEAFGGYDSNNLPFGSNTSTNTSQLSGKVAGYLPDVTFSDPFGSAAANISSHPTLYYQQPDLKNAQIHQWSLSLEHQIRANWMGRVSYVGSESHHLPWYASDINTPLVQTHNTATQNSRPYQPWGSIVSVRSGGDQSYNQFQAEVQRRYVNGVSMQAHYSWTRSLDDVDQSGGPQRPTLPRLDWGNTAGILRHQLVVNYLYALPFGRGRRFLANSNSAVNALVGGWQASGITTYLGGGPSSVSFSVPSNYVGWIGGRADRIAGVPLYKKGSGHNIVAGVPWFNPAAFGPPSPWTWGNSAKGLIWGPGSWNWDISASKEIPIHDTVHMIVRADFLDAFNHMNLSGINTTVSSTTYGGSAIPLAGYLTSGSGNRYIQVSARISF